MKKLLAILIIMFSLILTACGGGGGNGNQVSKSTLKDILTYSLNGTNGVIIGNNIAVEMPYGTDITNLIANFTIDGISVNINGVPQTSGTTANNFVNPLTYTVVAADGSTKNYMVTVLVATINAKDITAFSVNGTPGIIQGNNIAIEVPHGTESGSLIATFTTDTVSVTVGGKPQISGVSTNNFTAPITYVVTAADGSTTNYIVTVTVAIASAKDIIAFSLDGIKGVITGNNIAVTMPYGTDVKSLIATYITNGQNVTINGTPQFNNTTANNFTNSVIYTVTDANNLPKNYTVTVTVATASAKDILSFSLNGTNGVINGNNIAVTMPYATNIAALIATFTTNGASVKVNGVAQTNGLTLNDFTNPLNYVVTAADGSTRNYTVTVTIASANAKDIFSFALNGTPGIITGNNIAVEMPYGTSITALIATFITDGANVTVNGTKQTSGLTANDFSTSLTYKVTAFDGSTRSYTVTVTLALNSAKEIWSIP